MKLFIALSAVCTIAAAAVLPEDKTAQIIDYENKNDGSGNYYFRYKTSNGITREESGTLVNGGTKEEYIRIEGSYSYIDTDGNQVVSRYSADDTGSHQLEEPTPERVKQNLNKPVNIASALLGK